MPSFELNEQKKITNHQLDFTFDSVRNHKAFEDLSPSVVKKFWKYHSQNPNLWRLFERYAFQVKKSGRKRYGMQGIAERIRWHTSIETKGDEFKISNDHLSCYARLLMIEHPELDGLFQTKRSRSLS